MNSNDEPTERDRHAGGVAACGSDSLIGARYRLDDLVGTGGMGCVHRATDTRTGETVAIKTLRPDLTQDGLVRSRLQREAFIGERVQAAHVVRMLDHGEDPERGPYVVFEYLHGELLSQLLDCVGSLGVNEAVEIAIDLLRGLEAFHAAGVLHRDVKPENVFLVPDDERPGSKRSATLIDFGLSRAMGRRLDGTERVTLEGIVAGTPEYMAPEQIMDAEGQDQHVDVYALGVLLYQMLAGEQPFAGAEPLAIFERALHEDARPLVDLRHDIDSDLADCVHRAMAREARDRFPSARAMRLVLSHWLVTHRDAHGRQVADNPALSRILPGSVFSSKRAWFIAASFAVLLSSTAITLAWTRGDRPETSAMPAVLDARVAPEATTERNAPPLLATALAAPPSRNAPRSAPTIRASAHSLTSRTARHAPRSTHASQHATASPVPAVACTQQDDSGAIESCEQPYVHTPITTAWHGSLMPPTLEY